MAYPNDRKYSSDHEWLLVEGDEATVGITDFAQDQLGAVVYVDLPAQGDSFSAGDAIGEVESVKSVSEIYLPVSGEVIAVNEALTDNPGTINEDAYDEGWIVRIRLNDPSEVDALLDAAGYEASLG
ncbi:MAG: glycine cleavage system protein GcvH [Actinomycetes bacterium]|jgi:glycine cleavage system H protein|nr:glycine cleavage system protein GcvH [Actinomycetes bacterium]